MFSWILFFACFPTHLDCRFFKVDTVHGFLGDVTKLLSGIETTVDAVNVVRV